MRSSFMGLEVQKRSLQLAQKHLDITGHNLGNMKTPGYTRQRIDIHSLSLSGATHWKTNLTRLAMAGQGSSASGVSQIRNEYLDRRFREMVPQAAEFSTAHRIMTELEHALDAIDTFSLLDAFNQLKSTLERVALERPDAREMTALVRNQTINIASMIRTHHSDLTKLLENNLWEMERSLDTTNNLIKQIADYNKAITREYILDAGRIARGQGVSEYGPLEMLDKRNLLLDELAQYANIEVFQNNNGSVRVVMAGTTIIDDQDFMQIRMADYDDFNAAVLTFSNGNAFRPATGELKAYLDMVNGNGPYAAGAYQNSAFGIPYYINVLNVFAQEFAEIMNSTMDASLRDSGFFLQAPTSINPATGLPLRADNSNWERNLIWGGWEYEYNPDGTYKLDEFGEKIRRQEMVQARNEAGQLMVHTGNEDGWVYNSVIGDWVEGRPAAGQPVMILSYMRAQVSASNLFVSDEWLNDELLVGKTFDVNGGELVLARGADGQPLMAHQPQMVQKMVQGTEPAPLEQATRQRYNTANPPLPLFVQPNGSHGTTPTAHPVLIPAFLGELDQTNGQWIYHDVDGNSTTEANRVPIMVTALARNSSGRYIDAQGNAIAVYFHPAGTVIDGLDVSGTLALPPGAMPVPKTVPAWQKDDQGRYIDKDDNPLATTISGEVINLNARVPVLVPAFEVNEDGTRGDPIMIPHVINGVPIMLYDDGTGNPAYTAPQDRPAEMREVTPGDPASAELHYLLAGGTTWILVSDFDPANQTRMQQYQLHNGDWIDVNDFDSRVTAGEILTRMARTTDANGDDLEPLMGEHYVRTGEWRVADLDGSNLQRFVRELEAERRWGNSLDFHGCTFGKLQFLSNRLAQGIEYTQHEFDITMATVNVLLDNRDAISGVCETEEGIHMLKYQRWFNASARLMTSMDEALDIIINRMGRVGL
ncbi:MAG: hypothetical protein FWD35_02245 [Oscillospiraceae bacterium]|nr:hypothetical protein [Oscillospiraceae bacterium]